MRHTDLIRIKKETVSLGILRTFRFKSSDYIVRTLNDKFHSITRLSEAEAIALGIETMTSIGLKAKAEEAKNKYEDTRFSITSLL